jgi:CheY-like chemotaxis protein
MNIEKVLVVDDSKVAHLTLRKMLTERGIGVDWVG